MTPAQWLEMVSDEVSVPSDEEDTPSSRSILERILATIDYPDGVCSVISCLQRATGCVEGSRIFAFGSAVNGFGDSTSDVDLVLHASRQQLTEGLNLLKVSKRSLAPRALALLQPRLRKVGIAIHEKVLHARVPILKLGIRGIDCDLSVNNLLPVFNTRLLKSYAVADDRVVAVTREVKAWAKEQDVHGATNGHLSSYAFTLMVIFYMQIRKALPCLQERASEEPIWYHEGSKKWNVAMDIVESSLKSHVSVSFLDFARFYVEEFTWGTHVVSVRTGRLDEVSWYLQLKRVPGSIRHSLSNQFLKNFLHIEDPFDTSRNLNCTLNTGSSHKLLCALQAVLSKHLEEKQVPVAHSFYNSRSLAARSLYGSRRQKHKQVWNCEVCGSTEDLQMDPSDHEVCYCKKCWDAWEIRLVLLLLKFRQVKAYNLDWDVSHLLSLSRNVQPNVKSPAKR